MACGLAKLATPMVPTLPCLVLTLPSAPMVIWPAA
jgi:hypothetical protein